MSVHFIADRCEVEGARGKNKAAFRDTGATRDQRPLRSRV